MANRQNFSKALQVAIHVRATDANGVKRCEGCGSTKGPFDVHHVEMDAMKLDVDKKQRKLTIEDGKLLCRAVCHPKETKKDRAILALAERRAARHQGVAKPKTPIPQRPSQLEGPPRAHKGREPLPPRQLYR